MTEKKPTSFVEIFACVVLFAGLVASCSSSRKINYDYLYFQNGGNTVVEQQKGTLIQPNDLLSIQVYSRTLNQEQAAIFNVPNAANGIAQGYQVSYSGTIELPVIGIINVAGITKDQLQTIVIQKLTDYVKNPSVIVRFLQFNVNVLGEVRSPGVQKFSGDRVTVIDALSAAGDLTDFGKREDIAVIREEGGKKAYYTIDLRSKALFESPVYTLQPNDIVYVGPNNNKLRNLDLNPEVQRKTGLIFTVISSVVSIATLIVFLFR